MAIRKDQFIIPTRAEWIGMFLLIGFFGFFAQVLLTMGLQRETASRGSMAIYTQIVFATIFERVFFNAVPSLLSSFGTLLIVTSAIYVAVRLLPLTGLSTAS
jgi:drug/metabolite transporter (DMT)-like permease